MTAALPPAPAEAPARVRRVAVVGNPNVGKSTLFNQLTGLRQRVANYPGVTVDVRIGSCPLPDGRELQLLDLPGTYSLRPRSADEEVVLGALVSRGEGEAFEAPDVVVAVVDASNLRRNLYLLSELCDLELPVVVALNMVDEARRGGLDVPTEALREVTGLSVVETVASRGVGVDALREAVAEAATPASRRWRFERAEDEEALAAAGGETAWQRLRALEEQAPTTRERAVAGRYAWIAAALQGRDQDAPSARASSDRLDKVLLHPVLGPVIFFVVMALLFQAIFSWAVPLMDGIEKLVTALQGGVGGAVPGLLGSLLADGAIAGVGAVVVFLPQIAILFLLLGLLEDSGYMARAAFLVDRPLRAVGLSGRSFIPLLSSFACAIPGVMATRTIPSRRERLLAILAAPLMTCSARLPVYVLLIAAFVPATTVLGFLNLQGLVMLVLYLAGLLGGLTVAFLVGRVRRKRHGRELPLVVELPPYRQPVFRDVLLKLRLRLGDFLKRAGTVVFAVAVVLWVLMTFPRVPEAQLAGLTPEQQAATRLEYSVAGRMGRTIEPVIRPLGYDWKMGVGLIASFAAREVFVSTMGVIYSVGEEQEEDSEGLRQALQRAKDPMTGEPSFSLATVFSLLAFYVFALQCGATVAVVKREADSWKFAVGQLLGFLALAYGAAFVTYRVFSALGYA